MLVLPQLWGSSSGLEMLGSGSSACGLGARVASSVIGDFEGVVDMSPWQMDRSKASNGSSHYH